MRLLRTVLLFKYVIDVSQNFDCPDNVCMHLLYLQAAILSGNGGDEVTRSIVLLDVTPLSLGTRASLNLNKMWKHTMSYIVNAFRQALRRLEV